MDTLQLLGWSSAVRARALTPGWIRPQRCSVLYKYWPACPRELTAQVQSRGHEGGVDSASWEQKE